MNSSRVVPEASRLYQEGGEIPGMTGASAFALSGPSPSAVPILIAVPHAGRLYPGSLVEQMRNPVYASIRLEDRYVDLLANEVAAATGAALLVAHAPRAMIDLNRAIDDVDWEMFAGGSPMVGSYTPGKRVRSGLGLIPRRLSGLGELWNRRLDQADLAARIAGIHEPYHAALADALFALRERWGAALLIDLHSMPPLTLRGGQGSPEFVVGDRFGATCDGSLVSSLFSHLAEMGHSFVHNRPYAGGFALEKHAAPQHGVHAVQLEIDRGCYLDSRLAEPAKGFAAIVTTLIGLVRRLAGDVSALGNQFGAVRWQDAAE
jgi:N-formylglutamate amidohydrolase